MPRGSRLGSLYGPRLQESALDFSLVTVSAGGATVAGGDGSGLWAPPDVCHTSELA